MKSIFGYDSPLMQILAYIGDLIILNITFLICCIPLFTIGAAQAGMYTAMRVLNDKEDDTSPLKAFFRGFRNGFGKVTLAWGLLIVIMGIVSYACLWAYGLGLNIWFCLIPVCICALFVSQVPAFHSRFDCTPIQLIRNTWFLVIAHPLRSIGNAALIWLPVIVVRLPLDLAMNSMLLWMTIYYSAAFLFGELLLRKPFKTLMDDFNARNAVEEDPEEVQRRQEEEEAKKVFHDVPSK